MYPAVSSVTPATLIDYLLGILVINRTGKTNLLEFQDNVDHSLHYSRNCGKLMVHAGNLHGRNRITLQRGEQDTAQSIADGHTESGLQRSEFKLPNDEVDSSMITFSGF